MKRKFLSILLAFAMAASMILPAFAAEESYVELLEMLPGNEAVTGLFLEILNSGFLSNDEEDIRELGDKIDKAYTGSYTVSGYVANENSYYVSLGDSTTTGIGIGDPAYENAGYKAKVPSSAPYQVAQSLGLNVYTQYEQLALGGLRVTDLRYILDENFEADEYTHFATKDRINSHAGGLEKMRNDYIASLKKADLITISSGGCNFTVFLSAQVYGAIAEFLNEELKGPLNGMFGSKIKEALNQYIDLDSRTYDMNWEAYIGKGGKEQLDNALAGVKAKLIAEGIPESYSINLIDLAGDSLEMTLPLTLQNKLTVNVPVVELAVYFLECFLYGYVTFVVDSEAVFDKIHEIEPDAELVILSMYNPIDKMVCTFNDMQIPVGEYYGYMAKALSLYYLDYAKNTPNTTFVDVYNTESLLDEELGKGNATDLIEYLLTASSNLVDGHATRAGHTYMKDQILAALAPQEEGLPGDADGSGEVDYLDAMIVLQYHTGVIDDNELDLFCCDVDNSGEVDYLDAMMILQYHTGVISEL